MKPADYEAWLQGMLDAKKALGIPMTAFDLLYIRHHIDATLAAQTGESMPVQKDTRCVRTC